MNEWLLCVAYNKLLPERCERIEFNDRSESGWKYSDVRTRTHQGRTQFIIIRITLLNTILLFARNEINYCTHNSITTDWLDGCCFASACMHQIGPPAQVPSFRPPGLIALIVVAHPRTELVAAFSFRLTGRLVVRSFGPRPCSVIRAL